MIYMTSNLGEKLRTARLYRGFKKQTDITKPLGIAKQSYNVWETGKSLPTIGPISRISDLLNISPLYFFSDDTDIEKYDLLFCSGESCTLKFVPTRISEKIDKFIQAALKQPGIYLIITPGGIGVTRAIYEFQNIFFSKKEELFERLVIYDHAENFTKEELHGYVETDRGKTVLFVGNVYTKNYLQDDAFKVTCCELKGLHYEDFIKIIRKALPDASLPVITLIITETIFKLKKLSHLIKKIAQHKMDPKWKMDFDSITELCEKINKQTK